MGKIIYQILSLGYLRQKGKWIYIYSLKSLILSFWDLLRTPKQKWPKKAIWIQASFQRVTRDPKIFIPWFKKMLRVCITYRCNLTCKYCYAKGLENDFPDEMKLSDFQLLVAWAKQRHWTAIRLLGGEPTIHPQFAKMLAICYQNRMSVNFSTNNLFPEQILPNLNRFWLGGISINYTLGVLDNEQKALFRKNLEQLKTRKISFGFSYVIDNQDENWKEMLEDARLYKPLCIRASLALPGFSKQISSSEEFNDMESLSKKTYQIQESCLDLGIPFFFYRPLPLCMLSQPEWQKLRRLFPFLAFTRCPIGYKGDYGLMVVVNPDLSIFPCTSIFIKGPNIFTFKDRLKISQFYEASIKELLSKPLMELCRECSAHKNFSTRGTKQSHFDKGICQGGCFNFKSPIQSLCHVE